MTDREQQQKLEERKLTLVWIYNALIDKIDSYWLQDLAYSSKPLKEMINKKEMIRWEIDLINKQLECLE